MVFYGILNAIARRITEFHRKFLCHISIIDREKGWMGWKNGGTTLYPLLWKKSNITVYGSRHFSPSPSSKFFIPYPLFLSLARHVLIRFLTNLLVSKILLESTRLTLIGIAKVQTNHISKSLCLLTSTSQYSNLCLQTEPEQKLQQQMS